MKKLLSVLPLYVAALLVIVGVWYTAITANAPLSALNTEASAKEFLNLLVPWVAMCAVHFWKTGDPAPVDPPAKTERKLPAPPPPPAPRD